MESYIKRTKIRGLKRKWKLMLANLDKLAENIDDNDDEIFIAESFDSTRKISNKYRIELFDKLLHILNTKQNQDEKRYYLLWYYPSTDIFESTILIFNEFNEFEVFFKERKYNPSVTDSEHYRIYLNKSENSDIYVSARVKSEEMLSARLIIDDEEDVNNIPLILIANNNIISMAKKELS